MLTDMAQWEWEWVRCIINLVSIMNILIVAKVVLKYTNSEIVFFLERFDNLLPLSLCHFVPNFFLLSLILLPRKMCSGNWKLHFLLFLVFLLGPLLSPFLSRSVVKSIKIKYTPNYCSVAVKLCLTTARTRRIAIIFTVWVFIFITNR